MKYIRTENGIYKRREDTYIENNILYQIGYNFGRANLGEVIKQADTIEELCDEFVGVDKTCENGHQLLRAIPYKCANFWNGGVYGAVWCEWGLKFVAKLDDKGEWHLL